MRSEWKDVCDSILSVKPGVAQLPGRCESREFLPSPKVVCRPQVESGLGNHQSNASCHPGLMQTRQESIINDRLALESHFFKTLFLVAPSHPLSFLAV